MRYSTNQTAQGATQAEEAMAVLKSPREIELMREAGRVAHAVLVHMGELVRPGLTTGELGRAADELITTAGGVALFRGVRTNHTKFPFPAAICVSVNDEVVHGIPGNRVLREGDIVSIDCGVRMRGYCGDAATTLPVGRISAPVEKLLDATRGALDLALAEMRPGRLWSEVAGMIQRHVESQAFSVVRDFVGHGIGQHMHEEPKVPNYADRKQKKGDFRLVPGLVIAVEPMVNMGTAEVMAGDSTGWPQVTKDGRWSAHFEHTVAVTTAGVDILTDGR